jgi:hypothetical protein
MLEEFSLRAIGMLDNFTVKIFRYVFDIFRYLESLMLGNNFQGMEKFKHLICLQQISNFLIYLPHRNFINKRIHAHTHIERYQRYDKFPRNGKSIFLFRCDQ